MQNLILICIFFKVVIDSLNTTGEQVWVWCSWKDYEDKAPAWWWNPFMPNNNCLGVRNKALIYAQFSRLRPPRPCQTTNPTTYRKGDQMPSTAGLLTTRLYPVLFSTQSISLEFSWKVDSENDAHSGVRCSLTENISAKLLSILSTNRLTYAFVPIYEKLCHLCLFEAYWGDTSVHGLRRMNGWKKMWSG